MELLKDVETLQNFTKGKERRSSNCLLGLVVDVLAEALSTNSTQADDVAKQYLPVNCIAMKEDH